LNLLIEYMHQSAAMTTNRAGDRGSKWALKPSTPVLSQPKIRLFCFPQAGSGAWAYQEWQKLLLPDLVEVRISTLPSHPHCSHSDAPLAQFPFLTRKNCDWYLQIIPIELPGRSTRYKEPRIRNMNELVSSLLEGIGPLLQGTPFIFFGHSMGSWIAFATIQELQSRGGALPRKLFVSAIRSPSLNGVAHEPDGIQMHTLSSSRFWEIMERRYGKNPDLVSAIHVYNRLIFCYYLMSLHTHFEQAVVCFRPHLVSSKPAGRSRSA